MKPTPSSSLFASARSKLAGLTFGLFQAPVGAGMIELAGFAVPRIDDADDLRPVDRVVERLLHLQVEQLAVLLLLRVRVDDEVALLEPGESSTVKPAFFSVLIAVDGTVSSASRSCAFSADDHRVVVREHAGGRTRRSAASAPERVVALEERDLVLLVLDELERPGPDDRRVVREGLQVGAVVARVLAPDVLRKNEELFELAEDVAGRLLVVDDERGRVRRIGARDVGDQSGHVRRPGLLVTDVGVDRPRRVLGGQRLPVRPLRVRDAC